MNSDKKKDEKKDQDETRRYDKEYPENGDNFSTGAPDSGALPNNPAENEDAQRLERIRKKNPPNDPLLTGKIECYGIAEKRNRYY